MHKHISLVAALHIGLSVLGLLIAGLFFFVLVGTGVISRDQEAFLVLSIVGTVMFFFTVVLCIPSVIGGIGLLKHKSWARILVLILSAVNLLNIPVGTALGAYSFWVLLQDETIQIFTPKPQKKG